MPKTINMCNLCGRIYYDNQRISLPCLTRDCVGYINEIKIYSQDEVEQLQKLNVSDTQRLLSEIRKELKEKFRDYDNESNIDLIDDVFNKFDKFSQSNPKSFLTSSKTSEKSKGRDTLKLKCDKHKKFHNRCINCDKLLRS